MRRYLGGAVIGFDISSMPGILGIQAYWERFGLPEPFMTAIVTTMMPIGSIVGAFWSWYLVKTMAPKWALAYVCFIWTFGCVLQVALPLNSMLYIARFIAGVGNGAISALVPVYLVCLPLLFRRPSLDDAA